MRYEIMNREYREATGGTSIEQTLSNYIWGISLTSLVLGAGATGFAVNELLEYLNPDLPNIARYAIDALSASVVGTKIGIEGAKLGVQVANEKIRKTLGE